MRDGFIKVAAATPEIKVADCAGNAQRCIELIHEAKDQGVKVLCLPRLCLTGSTCGDLYLHDTLLKGAESALGDVLAATEAVDMVIAMGLPVLCSYDHRVYDCTAVLHRGQILSLVPAHAVPQAQRRWFTPGTGSDRETVLCGQEITLSCEGVLFTCDSMPQLMIGVENRAGDAAAEPPVLNLAHAGATLLLCPIAQPELVGRAARRRQLLLSQSARLGCAILSANAGEGESTTDQVYSGHRMVVENGSMLAEDRFTTGLTVSEVDVQKLAWQRRGSAVHGDEVWRVAFDLAVEETTLTRPVAKSPFVPTDAQAREDRCEEIFTLAALGLKKRLAHTHAKCAVVGLSGGLDSTLALLITARAMEMLNRPMTDIISITMPCFGTTSRTKSNAQLLAERIGTAFKTIDIGEAVKVHFKDIDQSMEDLSVTFENGQARERTQVLMDVANQQGGMVIGTGDLSELALGWATYNGDHMSMYAVNGDIPKTLVRHLVDYAADHSKDEKLAETLRDILDTPVSPELLPPKDGEIAQCTEDLVGPYELHDFFLYYILRWGFSPRKVLRLAQYALGDTYDRETLLKWLHNFYRRFFAQQFKRSCLPDGPQVGALGVSPRGGLVLPSDALSALWMSELEELN